MLVHLKLATELAKRNHTVHFITAECLQPFAEKAAEKMAPEARLHYISFRTNCTKHEEETKGSQLTGFSGAATAILNTVFERIDEVLSDTKLMSRLQALAPDIDLMVSDVLAYGMLVANKLGLQHIDMDVGTGGFLWEAIFQGAEPGTSFIPALCTFFPTNGMSFWQRVVNLAVTKITRGVVMYAYWFPNVYLQKVIAKHQITLKWPYTDFIYHMVNSNFILEPPRAIAPNTQYVGPMLPEPAKPLPSDLEKWLQGSGPNGTVLVSFGGTLQAPHAASRALMKAMQSMPDVRFVWKLSEEDQAALAAETAGVKNVYISSWLPQNDLLGHPKMRAFVTQGGYLSVSEAAYHAVPLLGIPFIPGQGEMISFAEQNGRAKRVPGDTLVKGRVDVFRKALLDILHNDSYKQAALVTSRRLKAVARPYAQTAAELVEYAVAVKDDGPFLYTGKMKQYWHQQVMLDVVAFYMAVAAAVLIFFQRAFLWLFWRHAAKVPAGVNVQIMLRPSAAPKHKAA